MFPSNKVTVLLVVVCIVVSHGLLVMSKPPVTKEQKDRILEECDKFIRRLGCPVYVVSRHSPCCDAVRAVENRDMDYVVLLLTSQNEEKEKDKDSISKILALHGLCELPAAPHHQQVK